MFDMSDISLSLNFFHLYLITYNVLNLWNEKKIVLLQLMN